MITDTASDRVSLYYRQGSSDKVYQAAIEPAGPGYVVTCAFGRRGATLQAGRKTPQPVGYDEARKVFDQLVRSKTAKGYTPGADGTPYRHTDAQPRSTGILPQLLNPIDEADGSSYLADDRWWMQEKFDGKRVLTRREGVVVTATNRRGLTIALAGPIAAALTSVGTSQCLLDGEAVGDVYHAFDLLELDGEDLRQAPYFVRYEALVDLVDPVASNALRYAETAMDAGTKAAMFASMRRLKREGVVFKDRTAPCTPGRPARGGPQLKLKFTETASCIVAGITPGKRSVGLELLDVARRVGVGSVTVPANHPVPAAGQVVEVRYLYAYPGGALCQPVLLGRRDDVDREDCRLAQLKYRAAAEDEADDPA
jgi:bifunctional non-homologous end joining protein LigD